MKKELVYIGIGITLFIVLAVITFYVAKKIGVRKNEK
jgi:hypothetical protein